jgi:ABC-type glutathione transport system ATPase component
VRCAGTSTRPTSGSTIAEVVQLWEPHSETIAQVGLLGDESGRLKFVRVSFDVEEEDVVALVGESDCGKTTPGKAAVGLQWPTAGAVRYRGQAV